MRNETVQQTQPQRNAPPSAGQNLFGDVAPKFAELTDNVLFATCGLALAFRHATAA